MQTSIEIGNKIAVAGKLKNLSQAELAAQMSITAQAVGKWERGESMPDILTFDGEIIGCAFEGLKASRVVLRNVTLFNTFFKNCNLKKLVFENCRADNLTLAFLKNSKANMDGITLLED